MRLWLLQFIIPKGNYTTLPALLKHMQVWCMVICPAGALARCCCEIVAIECGSNQCAMFIDPGI